MDNDKKEVNLESKIYGLESKLNHNKNLFERSHNILKEAITLIDYTLPHFGEGYTKDSLITELTKITARLISNEYKDKDDKINDLVKQAYITGKLEIMKNGEENFKKVHSKLKDLEPYLLYKE